MTRMNFDSSKTLRAKTPLMILAIAALALNGFRLLASLIGFLSTWIGFLSDLEFYLDYYPRMAFIAGIISSYLNLVLPIVSVLVCVFFLLYVLKLHQSQKADKIEAGVFGSVALYRVLSVPVSLVWVLIDVVLYASSYPAADIIFTVFFDFVAIVVAVLFVLAAVEAWKGKSKRIFGIIAPAAGILEVVLLVFKQLFTALFFLFEYEDFGWVLRYYILDSQWFVWLGTVILYAGLIVYTLRDKIVTLVKKK